MDIYLFFGNNCLQKFMLAHGNIIANNIINKKKNVRAVGAVLIDLEKLLTLEKLNLSN